MRTPRLLPWLAPVVTFLVIPLLLVAAPAGAATWHVNDPRDRSTGGSGDIRHAEVVAGAHRVKLRLVVQRNQGFRTSWELDVDRGQHGPEFTAGVTAGYPEITVRRWTTSRTRCAPHTVHVSADGKVLTASFRLRCLALNGAVPTEMRVHIYTGEEEETDDDCAPGGVPPCTRWSRWFGVG